MYCQCPTFMILGVLGVFVQMVDIYPVYGHCKTNNDTNPLELVVLWSHNQEPKLFRIRATLQCKARGKAGNVANFCHGRPPWNSLIQLNYSDLTATSP